MGPTCCRIELLPTSTHPIILAIRRSAASAVYTPPHLRLKGLSVVLRCAEERLPPALCKGNSISFTMSFDELYDSRLDFISYTWLRLNWFFVSQYIRSGCAASSSSSAFLLCLRCTISCLNFPIAPGGFRAELQQPDR